jgi:DNA-binding LytR/AlgR family response regulator
MQAPNIRALARALAAALRGTGLDRQQSGTGVDESSGERSPSTTRRPVPGNLERIASRVGERTTVLDVARISHFSSKDKLTFAVVNGREHVIDHTLSDLEARLDARRFARIHRATIVNIGFVGELFPAVDGGVLVRLKDDRHTELSVARDRVRELKERIFRLDRRFDQP